MLRVRSRSGDSAVNYLFQIFGGRAQFAARPPFFFVGKLVSTSISISRDDSAGYGPLATFWRAVCVDCDSIVAKRELLDMY